MLTGGLDDKSVLMRTPRFRRGPGVIGIFLLLIMVVSPVALAQDDGPPGRSAPGSGTTAWFGLPLPPKPGSVPAVASGARGPRPVRLPPGESAFPELQAAPIRADLEQLVAIAKESQTTREIGTGQLWGRISGFPSGVKTVKWAADAFRRAGISDVKLQPITQDTSTSFWVPLSWQVKILGDAAFGAGSGDVVLESAMPLAPSDIPGGTLTAPLVYVGNGSPALLDRVELKDDP